MSTRGLTLADRCLTLASHHPDLAVRQAFDYIYELFDGGVGSLRYNSAGVVPEDPYGEAKVLLRSYVDDLMKAIDASRDLVAPQGWHGIYFD